MKTDYKVFLLTTLLVFAIAGGYRYYSARKRVCHCDSVSVSFVNSSFEIEPKFLLTPAKDIVFLQITPNIFIVHL